MKLPIDAEALFSQSVLIQLEAHACYRAACSNPGDRTSKPGFGGNLLYAGELDAEGRAMTVAGNVAGCATLGVTANPDAQKQSVRDGVVDFVVTSLDEALRILKNELRKRTSVGVCVGSDRDAVEREMVDRGVLPDLVFGGMFDRRRAMSRFGERAREVIVSEPGENVAVIAWHVARYPARWMPKLDSIALDCLADDPWTHRWVRFSPRYFGRASLGERACYCEPQDAIAMMQRIEDSVKTGAIASEVSISLTYRSESKVLHLSPSKAG